MSDALITLNRAKYNLNQANFTTAEDNLLNSLIAAVSQAIGRYCRRTFDQRSYDELYDGTGDTCLVLRHLPVVSVERVASDPSVVLTLTNTSSSNQRATVSVTDSGLTLVHVASGTTTTDTSITWASQSTLSAVQTAVNALGNGWSARVASGYENWPSAELRALQGAYNAKNTNAELHLHVTELAAYQVDAERGWLLATASAWCPGRHNYRVLYTAGHASEGRLGTVSGTRLRHKGWEQKQERKEE